MAKVQGRCIFCNGGGLTKEHVFPKWMRTLLYGEGAHTNSRINVSFVPFVNSATFRPELLDRQGFIFNKRLRVVCRGCNGGWMSNIEAQSKLMITALIKGQPFALGEDEQRLLSLWSAVRTAVFERDDPSSAAMIELEYKYIRMNREPPPNWRIFLYSYSGQEWRTRMFHLGAKVQALGGSRPNLPNTQKTIVAMGNVVIMIISSTADNAATIVEKLSPLNMLQIWPYQQSIEWPVDAHLNDSDLRELSYGGVQTYM